MHTPTEIQSPRRRRRYSPAQKRQIVEETLADDASVSQVARRHDINANLLFRWRLAYRTGRLPTVGPALLPVQVTPSDVTADGSRLECDLGNGRRLTVYGDASERLLRAALEVLAR